MRTLLVFLLLIPTLEAMGASDQYILKSQGIYCEAEYKEAIEEIADANSDRLLKRAVGAAFMSGECINSGLDVPTLIDKVTLEKTPKGSTYYCYERRGQKNRQCSDIASVATVAEIQAERNGNFQVVADNDKILVVKCSEGGRVYIEKGAQWLRKSAVFFGSIEDLPVERKVNQDKESAARDGCKGQDGPPH